MPYSRKVTGFIEEGNSLSKEKKYFKTNIEGTGRKIDRETDRQGETYRQTGKERERERGRERQSNREVSVD
jgi:hypothetical protein